MFMLHQSSMIAHQMTVLKRHILEIGGAQPFLHNFDSVLVELFPSNSTPTQYHLYFSVPDDVCNQLSKLISLVTDPNGNVLKTKEAADIDVCASQWLMKVE